MKPLSDIKPRTHTGSFENRHGDLGTTASVLADAPVVGCTNIDAPLAEIGELRTVEHNPILLRSVKESL